VPLVIAVGAERAKVVRIEREFRMRSARFYVINASGAACRDVRAAFDTAPVIAAQYGEAK